MRGAAAPRTPRLKRKDTLHAYRVAANATDSLTVSFIPKKLHAAAVV